MRAQELLWRSCGERVRRRELNTVAEHRKAPGRSFFWIGFQAPRQGSRVDHVQSMAAEEVIQNAPSEGWFLVAFRKLPSQINNFDVISLSFNAGDHLNLSQPTANEDHVPTMEVNRPLVLHLRRNEKRPVGQNPVNRKS